MVITLINFLVIINFAITVVTGEEGGDGERERGRPTPQVRSAHS